MSRINKGCKQLSDDLLVQSEIPSVKCLKNVRLLPKSKSLDKGVLIGELDDFAIYLEVQGRKTAHVMPKNQNLPSKIDDQVRGQKVTKNIESPALFGGIIRGHFGHFLTESIGRAWAGSEVDPQMPIYFLANGIKQTGIVSYQREILAALGVRNPIHFVGENTKFNKMYVPDDVFNLRKSFDVSGFFTNWLRGHFPTPKHRTGPDIYISRSRLDLFSGRFLGEADLESIVEDDGYHVFHPQEHSISEQISAFQNASRVIVAESSAVHLLALVGGADQEVALIRRRPNLSSFLKNGIKNIRGVSVDLVDAVESQFVEKNRANPLFRGVSILDSKRLGRHLARLGMVSHTDFEKMNDNLEAEFENIQSVRRHLEHFKTRNDPAN